MKKKLSVLFVVVAAIALCMGAIACSSKSYTVTFTGEGVTQSTQTVAEGDKAIEPNDPVRDGFTFDGWYLGDQKYDFSTPVTGDITLTAKWNQNGGSSGEGEGQTVDPNVITGEGTKESPYILAHPNHLVMFSEKTNNPDEYTDGEYYKLGADIDMTGVEYTPAGAELENGFSGDFDGDGHTISNLSTQRIIKSGVAYVGLFAKTYLASVHDLTLDNFNYSFESYTDSTSVGVYAGAIAGYSEFTNFTAVTVKGLFDTGMQPQNSAYIGGLAGSLYSSTIDDTAYIVYTENCYADIEITIMADSALETAAVGGLFGYITSYSGAVAIINSRTDGEIYGGQFTGGIAGYTSYYTSIINCVSGANVTGTSEEVSYAGGIVGSMSGDGIVIDCLSTGKVKAPQSDPNSLYVSYAGGIVGYNNPDDYEYYYTMGATASNSYYTGTVSALGGQKNALGVKISDADVTDDFLKNTLTFVQDCWSFAGAESVPTAVTASDADKDYTLKLLSHDSTYDEVAKQFTDQGGYPFVGDIENPENSGTEVFWAWELSDGIRVRSFIPMIKDVTVTAHWYDVAGVATTYKCISVDSSMPGLTIEGCGTIVLGTDGSFQWITDSALIGEYSYNGENIIFSLNNALGEISGSLYNGTLAFIVDYSMSATVSYQFQPYQPSLYGEYISASGDILTFSGTETVSFESVSVKDGDYVSGNFEISGKTVTISGEKIDDYFSTMTATINDDGTLTVNFTAAAGKDYSVNDTFEKIVSVDYSDQPFVDQYSMASVLASYGFPSMSRYVFTFGPKGEFTYSSEYSDTEGKYYYFEDSNSIKIIVGGYASTLTYNAEENIMYGLFRFGSPRYAIIAPLADGIMRGYVIDGQDTMVFYNGTKAYLLENGTYVPDAVIVGTFEQNERVTVNGVDYYVEFDEDYPTYEGYRLNKIGPEEGNYTFEGTSVVVDGIGGVTGDKEGTYTVTDGIVSIYYWDDTFLAFDYAAAQADGYSITAATPDAYQGVWGLDDKDPVGGVTVYKHYYKLVVDGFGHATLFYLKDPDNKIYNFNWGEWGTYTETATGIKVEFNSSQSAEIVFYYDKNIAYSKKMGYLGESTFYRDGYTGTQEIPSLDPAVAGCYTGTDADVPVEVNLYADSTGTLNGNPFVGLYDGSGRIFFKLGATDYTITIGENNALTLVYSDKNVTLTRTGSASTSLPAAFTGTWSGTITGLDGATTRVVIINADGTGTYEGNEMTGIKYDYRNNVLTAVCNGKNIEMEFNYETSSFSFTAVSIEDNSVWSGVVYKE